MNLLFTLGDPNGIGPEIAVAAAARLTQAGQRVFLVGPRDAAAAALELYSGSTAMQVVNPAYPASLPKGTIGIITTGAFKLAPGVPSAASGKASFTAVQTAYGLLGKGYSAMVTAPLAKIALRKAGISFPGHTEMLAAWSGAANYAMLFSSPKMRGALVTIHKPLKQVSALITPRLLRAKWGVLKQSLITDFNIPAPKVAVLGINPHAGESGTIGSEELACITPFVQSDLALNGPFPPDAFFGMHRYRAFDAVLAMYHDQLLIPFKMLAMETGVNYTAGIPVVRTSPDHGTAYDIAWQGRANASSMLHAARLALKIAANRARFAGKR